jgi:hypothetical protein
VLRTPERSRAQLIEHSQEYERTGYTWEQYNALTGEGQRSHPFTGWTSMISLSQSSSLLVTRSYADRNYVCAVMSEKY